MRLLCVFLLLFSASLSAQAPSQQLLKDARDALADQVKVVEASPDFQRMKRLERIVNELVAMVEKAKAAEKAKENGSK